MNPDCAMKRISPPCEAGSKDGRRGVRGICRMESIGRNMLTMSAVVSLDSGSEGVMGLPWAMPRRSTSLCI